MARSIASLGKRPIARSSQKGRRTAVTLCALPLEGVGEISGMASRKLRCGIQGGENRRGDVQSGVCVEVDLGA
jgi:hypothetical protein